MRVLGAVVLLFLGLATAAEAAEELAPGGTFFDDDGNTHEGAIEAIAAATQDGVIMAVEFALRGERWAVRNLRALPTWVEDRTYRILPAARFNSASWQRTFNALGTGSGVVVVR